jgi:hypothetical protein
MNEYQMAIIIGGGITALFIVAYLLCWVCQWAWAWVDDGKASDKNWIAKKVRFSRWKYPVYLGDNREKPFGYAKDKKHEGKSVSGLDSGVDYHCTHNVYGGYFSAALLSFLLPASVLIAAKFYAVTLIILVVMLIAYLARMVIRNQKMFDEHVKDKKAHR